jgi:AraC family transcriptional regulator
MIMAREKAITGPETVKFPGIKLAGISITTTVRYGENFRRIAKFWRDYLDLGMMQKLHDEPFAKDHVEYGVSFPEDIRTGNFEYLLGIKAEEDSEVSPEYTIRELPPAVYAVFSTPPSDGPNFPTVIFNTWAFIFGEWLPKSGREINRRFPFLERFDERVWSDTNKVCEIHIPLR